MVKMGKKETLVDISSIQKLCGDAWQPWNLGVGATYLQLRKTCILQQNCSKTCILAS